MATPSDTTVLVVDDEASIRLLCRVNLELEGYRVIEAAAVADARGLLARGGVDVLLVDVHVGDADGRELVRELRAAGDDTPVALLTGTTQLAPDERAGADDVIEKPFSLERLLGAVAQLAGVHSGS